MKKKEKKTKHNTFLEVLCVAYNTFYGDTVIRPDVFHSFDVKDFEPLSHAMKEVLEETVHQRTLHNNVRGTTAPTKSTLAVLQAYILVSQNSAETQQLKRSLKAKNVSDIIPIIQTLYAQYYSSISALPQTEHIKKPVTIPTKKIKYLGYAYYERNTSEAGVYEYALELQSTEIHNLAASLEYKESNRQYKGTGTWKDRFLFLHFLAKRESLYKHFLTLQTTTETDWWESKCLTGFLLLQSHGVEVVSTRIIFVPEGVKDQEITIEKIKKFLTDHRIQHRIKPYKHLDELIRQYDTIVPPNV